MSARGETYGRELRRYLVGLLLAVLLTAAAFAAVVWRVAPPDGLRALVFGLGLLQVGVHFRQFLHIGAGRADRDRLWLVLFSVLIMLIMVAGTLVILFNLRHRMM